VSALSGWHITTHNLGNNPTLLTMKSLHFPLRGTVAAVAFGAALLSSGAQAGEVMMADTSKKMVEVEPPAEEPTLCDIIFDLPTLYKDKSNPYIQEIAITGRYQGQYYYVDANTGEDDGWNNRRWRLGGKVKFLNQFELSGQFNLNTSNDLDGRFFQDVDTLELEWTPSDEWAVVLGKHKPAITQEYSTSSSRILTVERSLLVNQVTPDKIGGATVAYESGPFSADLGVFSGALTDDWGLPEFDGGVGVLARFGYDVTEDTNIRLDYMYQSEDEGNDGFADYEHIVSLNSSSEWGAFGLRTDLIYAAGMDDVDDVFGIVVLPYYDVTDWLQLVARYQYATSDGDAGIRLQSRYERRALEDGSTSRGDQYHAIYGGINWYICGNNLKVMTGVEYSTLAGDADYDGVTFFAGIRTNF
jgi:phosphate-selective porin OprO/OprP